MEYAERDKREKNEMLVTGMQHQKGMKLLKKYQNRLDSRQFVSENDENADFQVKITELTKNIKDQKSKMDDMTDEIDILKQKDSDTAIKLARKQKVIDDHKKTLKEMSAKINAIEAEKDTFKA